MATLKDLLITLQRDHFTDRTEICNIFRKLIQTPAQLRLYRILAIYGPGGIGKTVLMREFRDICDENGIGSSIVNMDATNSPLELLTALRENWEPTPNGKPFREFDALLVKFHDLHMQIQNREVADGKISEVMGKVLGDVSAAAVGGAVSGLALGPVGVVIGAAGGALAGNVLDTSLAALRKNGLISRKDASFLTLLLPSLVSAFVRGTNELASDKQCVVIILDTYEYAEQFRYLNDWITGNLLPNLNDSALVVVSGRNEPRGKFWQTYSPFVFQHRLQPFDKSDIVNYLNARRIGPEQSDALFDLTAGLPLGAALWADIETQKQMGFADMASAHGSVEVVRAVVDRLLEYLDDTSRQAIRVCAIPRRFDEPILNLLIPQSEVHVVYEQLQRYSSLFRSRSGGLSMHHEVRQYLLDDFRSRNVELYNDLNVQLGEYYGQKAQLEFPYGRLWFENRTEQTYHLLAIDNKESSTLLNDIVDDACRIEDAIALESLLKMISDLPSDRGYQWAAFIKGEIYYYQRDYEQAKSYFLEAMKLPFRQIISVRILIGLCHTLWNLCEYNDALAHGARAKEMCEAINDRKGLLWLCNCLSWVNHESGFFEDAIRIREIGFAIAKELQLRPDQGWALNGLGTTYFECGDISRALDLLQQSLLIWNELGHGPGKMYTLYHIGEVYAESGRYTQAVEYFEAALRSSPGHDDEVQMRIRLGGVQALLGDFDQAATLLEQSREYAHKRGKPIYEARANLLLGHSWLQQQKWDDAQLCFARAIEISTRIEARDIRADALDGELRLRYSQNAHLIEILNAADALEAIGCKYDYHNVLADAHLFRGLTQLKALIVSRQHDEDFEAKLDHISDSFLQALIEALKFNSYVLDWIVGRLLQETYSYDLTLVDELFGRVKTRWQSMELDGQPLAVIEASLRARDGLVEHQSSIWVQLKRC